jgi:hypothetical protein
MLRHSKGLAMQNRLLLLAFPVLGVTMTAQAPPATRAAIADKLDTPQAHVYVATLQPHVPSPSAAGHATNRVLLYMDDGVMTRKEGTGPVETITFKRGDVRWRPASGAYVAENTSDHPIRILEIDLKGKPSAVPTATKLDPAVVDPKHYRVMLDNDYVRVLKVHFDPHDKGEQHEHILNRVVWYLNDQAGAKPDDVRMSGAAVHAEQNERDTPAERIAVELK